MRCIYNGVHPCGKCPACLANRQRAFCFRLDQERKVCKFYFWLTLQYDDDHVPKLENEEMCFSKEHCRLFFEKIRKRYQENGFKFKHFLVSEYGPNGTHRPHYHCLLLVYSDHSLSQSYKDRQEMKDFIIHCSWPNGHVTEKSFHGRVLSYLTKYCCKPEILGQKHSMKPFTLISRGIGLSYLDSISEDQKKQMIENLDFSVRYGSGKIQLPRYYVDKMLPHSLEDLRKSIPDDPDGDWQSYQYISDIRKRLSFKQRDLQLYDLGSRLPEDIQSVQNLVKERERHIEGVIANFKSKVNSRKDI